MSDRELIEQALEGAGLTADEWREGEDGLEAVVGRWHVIDDLEDVGFYADDEGTLTCSVVGAEEYNNQRAPFFLTLDAREGAEEVVPFEQVEPIA